jgi:hypothetical protein
MTWYFSDPPDPLPSGTVHDIELAREAATALQTTDAPEHLQVQFHTTDVDTQIACGVTYQKCGGGRRIIRKRIGGN